MTESDQTGWIPGATDPMLVSDTAVTCCGRSDRPHPPRLIELPSRATIACPDCHLTYRRAWDGTGLTRASWPRAT